MPKLAARKRAALIFARIVDATISNQVYASRGPKETASLVKERRKGGA
jgi:hypothetical protein